MRKATVLMGVNSDLIAIAQGTTRYWTPTGASGLATSADNREELVPDAGQIVRFVAKVTMNNLDAASTVSIVKNQGGGDEAKISVSYAAGETGVKTAVGTLNVALGDEIVVECISGSGLAIDTITVKNWAIIYYP